MVGVPGRSKGCNTCRKRKKGCDLERPVCGNCKRGQLRCGYERVLIVVQVDREGKGSYRPKQPQHAACQSVRPVAQVTSPADMRYRDLNRTALELECFESLRVVFAPTITSHVYKIQANKGSSFVSEWWAQLYELAPQSNLVRASFLSASAFILGHVRRDHALRSRGIELYGRAAQLLNRSLQPSQLAKRQNLFFDLILSGYALALYEFMRQETPNIEEQRLPAARFRMYYDRDSLQWSSREKGHMRGIMKLMRFQDPETFAEPSQHQLFVQMRQNWISLSLEHRRGTFLDSTEWRTKPWKGLHKTYSDTLWDALARVPTMFEAWDDLKANSFGHDLKEQAAMLRRQCYELEVDLTEWHDMLSTSCHSFTETQSAMLRGYIDTLSPEDLPDILSKHGVWYLYAWMMYWGGCIILYTTTPLIYLRFPPSTTELTVSASGSIGSYCLAIARSVKHFFGSQPVGLRIEMLLRIPVSIVQKVLENLAVCGCDPKLTEAATVLQRVGKTEPAPTIDAFPTEISSHGASTMDERELLRNEGPLE